VFVFSFIKHNIEGQKIDKNCNVCILSICSLKPQTFVERVGHNEKELTMVMTEIILGQLRKDGVVAWEIVCLF